MPQPWERNYTSVPPMSGGMTATGRLMAPIYEQAVDDAELDRLNNQTLIEQQLKAPLNTGGELGNLFTRFDLARSNKASEKAQKLQDAGYESRVVNVPEGEIAVFREPGEEAFRRIDSPEINTADFLGDIGALFNLENAAGTAATVLAPEVGLPARMVIVGGSTAAGNMADQGVEELRGYQDDSLGEMVGQAGVSGGSAVAGEGFGALLNRMRGAVTGETGFMQPRPEIAEARRIVGENPGLLPPTLGQSNQFLQRAENRIAQTGDKIPMYRQKQKEALKSSLEKLVAGDSTVLDTLDDETLMMLNDQLERDLLSRYDMTRTAQGGKNIEAGGKALTQARDAYQKGMDAFFKKSYPELWANRPEGVYFDVSGVKELAQDILAGRPIPLDDGTMGTLPKPISAQMRSQLQRMVGKEAELNDAGEVVKEAIPGYADQIDDPELLQEIAGLFRDTAQPDPLTNKRTVEGGLAQQIINQLNDARYNPAGLDDSAEGFGKQWADLSSKYKSYRDTLDLSSMKELETTENPYGTLEKFVQPGNPARLRQIKDISTPDQFKKVQEGFQDYLASDPSKINAVLDGYKRDLPSLRMLMSEEQEKSFRVFGNAFERLGEGPARKYLTTQGDLGTRTLGILEKSTDEQFDEYIKAMTKLNPQKTEQIKSAMLRGVVQQVLEKHTKFKGGMPDFNLNGFANEMDKLIRTGRIKKIGANAAQVKALQDRTLLASVYGKTGGSDFGASLGGSADVQDILTAPGTGGQGKSRFGEAYQVFWDNAILANVMLSPKAQRVLLGSGRPESKLGKKLTRGSAMAMGLVADDIGAMSDLNVQMDKPVRPEAAKKILNKKEERK